MNSLVPGVVPAKGQVEKKLVQNACFSRQQKKRWRYLILWMVIKAISSMSVF